MPPQEVDAVVGVPFGRTCRWNVHRLRYAFDYHTASYHYLCLLVSSTFLC